MTEHTIPPAVITLLIEPSGQKNSIDHEGELFRAIMRATLKYSTKFEVRELNVQLTASKLTNELDTVHTPYVMILRDGHNMSPTMLATVVDYLANRTVYLAEPIKTNAAITANTPKTAVNNRYFYNRNTLPHGTAFRTEQLRNLLNILGDIDLSTLYLNFRLYFGIASVTPLEAAYSTGDVTYITNGFSIPESVHRLFTAVTTTSGELRVYLLRYITLFLRNLRASHNTSIPLHHLSEIIVNNELLKVSQVLEERDLFELDICRWIADPGADTALYKYLSTQDAYWHFGFGTNPEALYNLNMAGEEIFIQRIYLPKDSNPEFNNPAFVSYYDRPINQDSVILFFDRGGQADDNAEYLYDYFRQNHPEFRNIFFALYDTSPDWKRLEAEGYNLVKLFSPEFYELFLDSDLVVSSQIFNVSYKGKSFRNSRFFYLQHGVQLNDMSDWVAAKFFDVFVATGKPEADYLASITPHEVINSGLPRYETLERKVTGDEGDLVFMPTWRFNLRTTTPHQFTRSEYFQAINNLINDRRLLDYLNRSGRKLKLKLHPNTAGREHLFRIPTGVELTSDSYRQVIESAALVFTDYSSVVIDAAFVGTPIAYYQWEGQSFFDEQPYTSMLDFKKQGLGPVLDNHEEMIDYLINERFLNQQEAYSDRYDWFFEGVEKAEINSRIVERMLSL